MQQNNIINYLISKYLHISSRGAKSATNKTLHDFFNIQYNVYKTFVMRTSGFYFSHNFRREITPMVYQRGDSN